MRVVLAPSTTGPESKYHQLSTFVINDVVAIDAGCLGLFGGPAEQARVRHVFLTHSHIDHLASLPIFLENVQGAHAEPVTVYGGEEVLDCLQRDVFNDRLMPDFIRISRERKPPFLRLERLTSGTPVLVDGLRVTPVPVNHAVPTFAFVIEGPDAAVAIVTDTGPTEQIWQRCKAAPSLKAVFLEAAFPDSNAWLAEIAQHLTTSQFVGEVRKLGADVPVFAVHLKPRFHDQIVAELAAHGLPNVRIGIPGVVYSF
jgi:ribonuclease BN (tRNA processing enzyme)